MLKANADQCRQIAQAFFLLDVLRLLNVDEVMQFRFTDEFRKSIFQQAESLEGIILSYGFPSTVTVIVLRCNTAFASFSNA